MNIFRRRNLSATVSSGQRIVNAKSMEIEMLSAALDSDSCPRSYIQLFNSIVSQLYVFSVLWNLIGCNGKLLLLLSIKFATNWSPVLSNNVSLTTLYLCVVRNLHRVISLRQIHNGITKFHFRVFVSLSRRYHFIYSTK